MFLASGALGILAVVFGLVGIRRAGRREASNRGMAIAGLVTGVIAFAMAIWGISVILSGLNSLSGELDRASSGNTVPSVTHAATRRPQAAACSPGAGHGPDEHRITAPADRRPGFRGLPRDAC